MGFEAYGNQVHAWIEGVLEGRGVKPGKTLELCRKLLDYGEENGDEKLLGFAYYHMGEMYYLLNDVDRLFLHMSRSLTYLENTRQYELAARAYNILAITSVNQGNVPVAMDYYLSSLAYCEQHHLDDVAMMVDINIGTLYNKFGEYKKAQGYFERAHQMLLSHPRTPDYHTLLMNIYIGMGNSFLYREQLLKAQEYEKRAVQECFLNLSGMEQVCFCCFQARLYHSMGKISLRDACISQIQQNIHEKMALLDIFDDFYSYCELLLSIGYYNEFLEVLRWLEEPAEKMGILYMQKRLLLLRIRYYRIIGVDEKYLEACGHYYELTEQSEKENKYMISSILNMRHALDETSRKRQEVERENRSLKRKSETDALTGLANRFRLNEFSEKAFERALDQQTGLAVEILDVDYFKQYNDNYGHQAGDTCIRRIASEVKKLEQNENVFCARYGGDEFIVFYENYSKEDVERLAEKLKNAVMGLNMEHEFSMALPIVTISQGICYDIPHEGMKVWDFLHTADRMLYKGKKKSRNSIFMGCYGEE